ncbi:MAG: hypothetical protein JRE20_01690 [Deltaproteobacteria bacterium]|nr:hypothetical protein [Deltaproteobacteria bacterium]
MKVIGNKNHRKEINPEFAVAIYWGLKILAATLVSRFSPQHIYGYAFVVKSLQLHVSLRFSAPRYDTHSKIWVKKRIQGVEGYSIQV